VSLLSHCHYDHLSDGDHPDCPQKLSDLQTRNADLQWQSCEAFSEEHKEINEADPVSYFQGQGLILLVAD